MSKEELNIDHSEGVFAFVLGREQKIALAELEAVLRRFCIGFDVLSLHQGVVIIKTEKLADSSSQFAERMMSQLGGTVKIFELNQNAKCKMQNFGVETYILEALKENNSSGTLNFGVSDYSGKYSVQEMNKMGIAIKIKARKSHPVRFINNRDRELSSATSYHKIWKTGGIEVGIFRISNDQFPMINKLSNEPIPQLKIENCKIGNLLVGRLMAVSNPDEWSRRDYGKPAGDKFSGMMPPKLARMMINLALDPAIINDQFPMINKLSNEPIPQLKIENCKIENLQDVVVLDPFCGSGNILMEAALLGCNIIGSDISEKAVEDSRANMEWLISNDQFPMINKLSNEPIPQLKIENCKIENSIFVADATSFDFAKKLKTNAYNLCIVTEPYLGKPKKIKYQISNIKNEISELKKLYLDFFSNAKKLKTNAYNLSVICFVFPIIETLDAGSVSLYDECLDDLCEMGYNTLCTLEYGRDYQVVKREIVLLAQE